VQECAQALEGAPAADVVDEDGARGAAVVAPRDAAEALCACRVPELELDARAARVRADGYYFGGEFYADGLRGEDPERRVQVPVEEAGSSGRAVLALAPWWCLEQTGDCGAA
jgi:hypothetical protein